MKTRVHFHGELVIVEGAAKPEGLKQIKPKEDVRLAASEVTGNDHMLQIVPGVHVFADNNMERFFVSAKKETKVYCKLKDRHDDLQLDAGCDYEIFPAKEWDHLTRERRNVAD